uniref:Chemokine interleukin-8-like domain-containing protein n=1 Tax=Astyanax mexicanus TaxID=7994 RepID=A0A3B1JRS3_ASTMX
METRTVSMLLLIVCAVIIFTATTTEGSIPACCVELSRNIPCMTLKKVKKYDIQNAGVYTPFFTFHKFCKHIINIRWFCLFIDLRFHLYV